MGSPFKSGLLAVSVVAVGMVVGCGGKVLSGGRPDSPGGGQGPGATGGDGGRGPEGGAGGQPKAGDGGRGGDGPKVADGGHGGQGGDGPKADAGVITVPTAYPKDGFCNDAGATWAWCEDFDGQGMNGPAAFEPASSGIAFRSHSHTTITGTLCETSKDCTPHVQGGSLFLNAEDSGFGMNVLRIEQPFDFAGREGRIHYRSDMKGHGRMHEAIHIGPLVSNSMPDLRFVTVLEAVNSGPAIDVDYIGEGLEPFQMTTWKDGQKAQQYVAHGPLGITRGDQHDIDVYVSRTRVRILLDGKQIADQTFNDIGFDRGYVYFAQLAYNPAKDGHTGDADNRFLWDNLAFDGPSLPKNSLTPADKQEIFFRAWSKKSCTVRNLPADGPINPGNNVIFDTWHVQLGIQDPLPSLNDITCVEIGAQFGVPWGQVGVADIQVVKR